MVGLLSPLLLTASGRKVYRKVWKGDARTVKDLWAALDEPGAPVAALDGVIVVLCCGTCIGSPPASLRGVQGVGD